MRENRPYGSEGGESSLTGLPYPYFAAAAYAAQNRQLAFQLKMVIAMSCPQLARPTGAEG